MALGEKKLILESRSMAGDDQSFFELLEMTSPNKKISRMT